MKNINKRLAALSLAGTMLMGVGLTGCKKEEKQDESSISQVVEETGKPKNLCQQFYSLSLTLPGDIEKATIEQPMSKTMELNGINLTEDQKIVIDTVLLSIKTQFEEYRLAYESGNLEKCKQIITMLYEQHYSKLSNEFITQVMLTQSLPDHLRINPKETTEDSIIYENGVTIKDFSTQRFTELDIFYAYYLEQLIEQAEKENRTTDLALHQFNKMSIINSVLEAPIKLVPVDDNTYYAINIDEVNYIIKYELNEIKSSYIEQYDLPKDIEFRLYGVIDETPNWGIFNSKDDTLICPLLDESEVAVQLNKIANVQGVIAGEITDSKKVQAAYDTIVAINNNEFVNEKTKKRN